MEFRHVRALELAADIAAIKEAHHFYPVLFYMRFAEPYYSMSFAAFVLLDTVTIIRSVLNDRNATVQKLRALDQIWEDSLLLLTSVEKSFLSQGLASAQQPDAPARELCEKRVHKALPQLQAAGLETAEYADACSKYVELRSQWDGHIQMLAPSMLYSMQQIDPETYGQAH